MYDTPSLHLLMSYMTESMAFAAVSRVSAAYLGYIDKEENVSNAVN